MDGENGEPTEKMIWPKVRRVQSWNSLVEADKMDHGVDSMDEVLHIKSSDLWLVVWVMLSRKDDR